MLEELAPKSFACVRCFGERTWRELVALHAEVLLVEITVSQAFCVKVKLSAPGKSSLMSQGVKYTPRLVPELTRAAHIPTPGRRVSAHASVQQNRPIAENIPGIDIPLFANTLAHAGTHLIEQTIDAKEVEHWNAVVLALHFDIVPSTPGPGS